MNTKKPFSPLKTCMCLLVFCLIAALLPFSAEAKKKSRRPKLSKSSVTLKAGKSTTLKVSRASGRIKWSVSDKSIVSIKKISSKKYKITAKKAGRTKVTVKAGGKKRSCTVKVYAPDKRIPVYTGDANLDYLLKLMTEDAGVKSYMSDEQIAWKIYKWVARHCVYEYEGPLKYGKQSIVKWPPYGLKTIYDLEGLEEKIAAYKASCDALAAAGKIRYSMKHVPSRGKNLYKTDGERAGSTVELYQKLSGNCIYMASIYTNLCEYMGLKAGINIGKTYNSRKKKFVLHYISYVKLYGKKYYVDPGAAVHKMTRNKKFKTKYYKMSSRTRKKNYRLGRGKKEF